jgi:hypothetical protein
MAAKVKGACDVRAGVPMKKNTDLPFLEWMKFEKGPRTLR